MPKRQRGAQPKNTNARKHGFYSAGLGASLRNALRRARSIDDKTLTMEIQLARAYLSEVLRLEPENADIIGRMLGTITRMLAINKQLDVNEEREMGTALQELLAELMPHKEPVP